MSRLIWSVADLLRGHFKPSEYGRVVLPFTVLRRLDCLLAPTRREVLDTADRFARHDNLDPGRFLQRAAGHPFYNTSPSLWRTSSMRLRKPRISCETTCMDSR